MANPATQGASAPTENYYNELRWPHTPNGNHRRAALTEALYGAIVISKLLASDFDLKSAAELGDDPVQAPLNDFITDGLHRALSVCLSSAMATTEGLSEEQS